METIKEIFANVVKPKRKLVLRFKYHHDSYVSYPTGMDANLFCDIFCLFDVECKNDGLGEFSTDMENREVLFDVIKYINARLSQYTEEDVRRCASRLGYHDDDAIEYFRHYQRGELFSKTMITNASEMRVSIQQAIRAAKFISPDLSVDRATSHLEFHAIAKDSDSVFFYEDGDKYAGNQYTIMSYGRYYAKYISQSSVDVERAVENFRCILRGGDICFTRDTKEIVKAYRDSHSGEAGCGSCMSHASSDYDCYPHHPVEVYGGESDIGIAYIRVGHLVRARALIDYERMRYVRIYPTDSDNNLFSSRLRQAMEEKGFTHGYGFDGARLNYIQKGKGFVCAYIDGDDQCVDVSTLNGKTFLRVTECGDFEATNTSGVLHDRRRRCDDCEDAIDDDACRYVHDRTLCESCYADNYTYCSQCNEDIAIDDARTLYGRDESFCDYCANRYGVSCEGCSSEVHQDYIQTTDDDCSLCQLCYDRSKSCDDCSKVFHDANCLTESPHDQENRCADCHADHMESESDSENDETQSDDALRMDENQSAHVSDYLNRLNEHASRI